MRRRILPLIVFAAAVVSRPSFAQQASPVEQEAAVDQPLAPVVVDGVTLFRVRGITGLPAEQRAAEIAGRIRALGANRSIPVDSIVLQQAPIATFVVARDTRVMGVTEADAQLEGTTPAVLAEFARRHIADAVTRYRHDREVGYVARRLGYAAVATVAFALFMSLGRRGWRRLRDVVDRRYRARVHDVQIRNVEVVRGEMLWQWLQHGRTILGVLLVIAAAYTYASYVLQLFPWSRALGNDLADLILDPLRQFGASVVAFLPDLVFLVVLGLIVRFVMRFMRVFMGRVGSGEIKLESFDPEWAQPTERILRFAVVVFALIIAYPYIPGSGSEAFKGVGLILGLMFSLGSPSVIGNLVAGLSLAFRRAFRVGDRVKIGDHLGYVAQVRLLTTYLRSVKNEEIVIPNSMILNSEVVNYSTLSKDPGVIIHSTVGIGYETPWRHVEAMLLEAARRTPGVQPTPGPYVLQKRLGDFAIEYEINAYVQDSIRMGLIQSDMHRNILDIFNEFGVQIMTPAYEGDPAEAKIVPKDRWNALPIKPIERVIENAPPSTPADISPTTRADGGVERLQRP